MRERGRGREGGRGRERERGRGREVERERERGREGKGEREEGREGEGERVSIQISFYGKTEFPLTAVYNVNTRKDNSTAKVSL